MNKFYIMYVLNEIIDILSDIKDDESSCNEGSLTDSEYDRILSLFNLVFKELIKD